MCLPPDLLHIISDRQPEGNLNHICLTFINLSFAVQTDADVTSNFVFSSVLWLEPQAGKSKLNQIVSNEFT